MRTLTKKDGDETEEVCPDCGTPTYLEAVMVPIITDIPDCQPTGELHEICTWCGWTSELENSRQESLTDPKVARFEAPDGTLYDRLEYPGMVEWMVQTFQFAMDGLGYVKDWEPVRVGDVPQGLKKVAI